MRKTAPESAKTQKLREKLRKILVEQDKMMSKEALAQMIEQIRFGMSARSRIFSKRESSEIS